ncbi:hypothetical protein R2647_08395 [Streptococcus pasteurianus]|uniref:hypothetical protein n=2 Tax=Streptococcus TaxID=1301 RepID=UPI002945A9FF|nr:hypothetical protein [Streptococcus pasteurianus]MDV5151639.1 hypothetical protein [Streptococcus pasteurianus]
MVKTVGMKFPHGCLNKIDETTAILGYITQTVEILRIVGHMNAGISSDFASIDIKRTAIGPLKKS